MLQLFTRGGADDVQTVGLSHTAQSFATTAGDMSADTFRLDAEGFCAARLGDTFDMEARQPITISGFATVLVGSSFCRADPCLGAIPTEGCTVNGVRNQLCRGTSGDDVIVGTNGADVILAGDGRDRVQGGSGDDLLCGQGGPDKLSGSAGDDILAGGPGEDSLTGGIGRDLLLGGDDDDDLSGGGDADDLDGGRGDDRVRSGGDGDTLRGGEGLDRLDGGAGDDSCTDPDQPGPFLRCELP